MNTSSPYLLASRVSAEKSANRLIVVPFQVTYFSPGCHSNFLYHRFFLQFYYSMFWKIYFSIDIIGNCINYVQNFPQAWEVLSSYFFRYLLCHLLPPFTIWNPICSDICLLSTSSFSQYPIVLFFRFLFFPL